MRTLEGGRRGAGSVDSVARHCCVYSTRGLVFACVAQPLTAWSAGSRLTLVSFRTLCVRNTYMACIVCRSTSKASTCAVDTIDHSCVADVKLSLTKMPWSPLDYNYYELLIINMFWWIIYSHYSLFIVITQLVFSPVICMRWPETQPNCVNATCNISIKCRSIFNFIGVKNIDFLCLSLKVTIYL